MRLEEVLTQHITTRVRTRSKLAPFVQLVQDKNDGLEFKRFEFNRRIAHRRRFEKLRGPPLLQPRDRLRV